MNILQDGERAIGFLENCWTAYKEIDYDVRPDTEKWDSTPFTITSFLELVNDMSYDKSSRHEDLNSRLLLDTMWGIPHVFVKICNCSFRTGEFPESWKLAQHTIIPKKGDLRDMENLCPISILPLLGKVLENHINK